MKVKIADLIIALLFIAFAVASFSFLTPGGDSVTIDADGKRYTYPLSENRTVEVAGLLGITTIEIKDANVRITDSPCPNKTCLYTKMGSTICCLPNRVLVTLSDDGGVDAYAY